MMVQREPMLLKQGSLGRSGQAWALQKLCKELKKVRRALPVSAGEIIQSVKYLLCKHEALSAGPQNPSKKSGVVVCTCYPIGREEETGKLIPGAH